MVRVTGRKVLMFRWLFSTVFLLFRTYNQLS